MIARGRRRGHALARAFPREEWIRGTRRRGLARVRHVEETTREGDRPRERSGDKTTT